MLLDANGNPVEAPPATAGDAPPAPEAPPPEVNPLEPIMVEMRKVSECASGGDTEENRNGVREHLAKALELFGDLRASKARNGRDYTIGIVAVPGRDGQPALRVDVDPTTRRGRELLENWEKFMGEMETRGRAAQTNLSFKILDMRIQALEGIVNQLLLRTADLERKVLGPA